MSDPTGQMNRAAGRTTTRSKSTAIGTAVAKARAAEKAKQDAADTATPAGGQQRRKKPRRSADVHASRFRASKPGSAKGGFLPADHR